MFVFAVDALKVARLHWVAWPLVEFCGFFGGFHGPFFCGSLCLMKHLFLSFVVLQLNIDFKFKIYFKILFQR